MSYVFLLAVRILTCWVSMVFIILRLKVELFGGPRRQLRQDTRQPVGNGAYKEKSLGFGPITVPKLT